MFSVTLSAKKSPTTSTESTNALKPAILPTQRQNAERSSLSPPPSFVSGRGGLMKLIFCPKGLLCSDSKTVCSWDVVVRVRVVPPLPPVNGHLPKNHKIHSQNGLERCPIDHFRDPKIRRFRNSKPAFSDQKKVQKMIIFWIWTCWDPKIRRFRNSKPAFGDLKKFPKSDHLSGPIEPLHRLFGPPCPAGVI